MHRFFEDTCVFPGCEEPRDETSGLHVCEAHVEAWNADATLDQWRYAKDFLESFLEIAKVVGNDKILEILHGGLDRASCEIIYWESEPRRLHGEL